MFSLPFLTQGDTIDIIAPSYASTPEEQEKACAFLRLLELKPRLPNLSGNTEPYHAESDEVRFSHLKAALDAPDSKAIWGLRGGYGAARLIPMLERLPKPAHKKWLIGFSDITVLHLFFQQHWGWPTLHAPVLFQLGLQKTAAESVDKLISVLFGQSSKITYRHLQPLNDAAKIPQTIQSTVTGGNLSLLQTSIGTSWQVDTKRKILFIEEVGEKGYSIDRMLTHLEQAGCLKDVAAILFGDMKGMPNQEGEDGNIDYAVKRFASHQIVPVLRISGIGHGAINNPLMFNVPATLTLDEKNSLQCVLAGE